MSVHITYTGDASVLLREEEKLRDATKEIDRGYQEAARTAALLERQAKKAFEESLTPLQKYNNAVGSLNALLRLGRIDQDQHAAAVSKAEREYRKANEQLVEVVDLTEKANQETRRFTDIDLAGYFMGVAGGILTAQGAVDTFLGALREIDERKKAAAQFTMEGEEGLGPLAQLASSPEENRRLIAKARELFATGGAASLGAAGKSVFEIESAGKMGDFNLLRDLTAKRVLTDLGGFVQSGNQLQTTIGESETGDIRALLSKSLAASKSAPASAESILQIVASSGGMAKTLGTTDEDLLAAGALFSAAARKDERAETLMTAFMEGVTRQNDQLQATDISSAVAAIEKMNLNREDLQKFLGGGVAVRAFDILSDQTNKQKLAATRAEIEAANDGKLVDQVLANADADAAVVQARAARIRAAQLAIAEETGGVAENRAAATRDAALQNLIAGGASDFDQGAARFGAKWADMFGLNDTLTTATTVGAASAHRTLTAGTASGIGLLWRGLRGETGEAVAAESADVQKELLDVAKQSLEIQGKTATTQRVIAREKLNRPQ